MKGFKHKPLTHRGNRAIVPGKGSIMKQLVTIIGIILLIGAGWAVLGNALPRAKTQLTTLLKSSISTIGSTVGDTVETDEMGQISVLMVGIGGKGHRGSYNTDSMMVASYSPKTRAVTFVSLPRDLYVNIDTNRNGRINTVLSSQINDGVSLTGALSVLTKKVSSIMGIPIDHYVMVDFEGFEKMIDTLGGIQVNVPKKIVDPTYPADEFAVMTLVINSGVQMMDGDTALKYARSRHTTSDFDRSLRQQQIIQGVVKQLLAGGGLLKLKQLQTEFNEAVVTDFDFGQLLGLSKYLNRVDHYFSFVLQSDCNEYYKLRYPGCLLYSPSRDDFGGAAILLPEGARAGRISYYNNIQQFTYYTIYQQPFLVEGARILLWNGIDSDQLLPGQNPNGVMGDLATKLVTYGFTVVGIGNNNIKSINSKTIKIGTGDYDVTADLLRDFAPVIYDQATVIETLSGTMFSGTREVPVEFTGVDLIMVIGNDYLSKKE